MESRIETLEKEVTLLQSENDQYLIKERAFLCQIQELERRCQLREAEVK